jgi:hypothetical protein
MPGQDLGMPESASTMRMKLQTKRWAEVLWWIALIGAFVSMFIMHHHLNR